MNSVNPFCNTNAISTVPLYALIGIFRIKDAVDRYESGMVHSTIVQIIIVQNMMKPQEYVQMEMSKSIKKKICQEKNSKRQEIAYYCVKKDETKKKIEYKNLVGRKNCCTCECVCVCLRVCLFKCEKSSGVFFPSEIVKIQFSTVVFIK